MALWTFVSKADARFAEQPALARAASERRAVGSEGLCWPAPAQHPHPDLHRTPRGPGLGLRCKAHDVYGSPGKMPPPAPPLWVGWRLPGRAAASDIAPEPGLGQGAGGGAQRGRGAAALAGLTDLLWQGRLEAGQTLPGVN